MKKTPEQLEYAISQYLDGTLPPLETAALEERLASDAEARELLAEFRRLDELVRGSAGAGALPEIAWDRFASHLSDQIEQAVTRVENCRDDNKPDQGRNAAARQHAVIHFEHEEGAGQRQDVERAAHDPDAGKSAAAAPKGGGQL